MSTEAQVSPLKKQIETDRAVEYWRTLLRQALADNSTVDYYNISESGIDNLALVAAHAVVRELASP